MSRRGPYKRYLSDTDADVPKETHRRRKKEDVNEMICNYLLSVTVFMLHQRDLDSPSDDGAEDTRRDHNDMERDMDSPSDDGAEDTRRDHNDDERDMDSPSDDGAEDTRRDHNDMERDMDSPSDDGAEDTRRDHNDMEDIFRLDGSADPIYPGSAVTKGQTILMLLVFILRHRLSRESLVDLLTLLDILFPGTLPATKFLFDKCFVSIEIRFEIHFYCESCHEYVCKDRFYVDSLLKVASSKKAIRNFVSIEEVKRRAEGPERFSAYLMVTYMRRAKAKKRELERELKEAGVRLSPYSCNTSLCSKLVEEDCKGLGRDLAFLTKNIPFQLIGQELQKEGCAPEDDLRPSLDIIEEVLHRNIKKYSLLTHTLGPDVIHVVCDIIRQALSNM
ncbi:uncharacterized protein LOC134460240 [Engraulis encrasicolus]|uniref:uncharacterized protein LOC134460240 n=1 Tax=Engraulis encrasicolus TaxID=184585 RepID=UPI002FD520D7